MGLTQLELAEKLNYSDKTLSKWERGESMPDIVTLKQLADIFMISVDVLISTEDTIISFVPVKERKKISKRNIISISLLSAGIVWFIATIAFVILNILPIDFQKSALKSWVSFIYAIPITAILFLIFSCIWGNNIYQFFTTSFLLWTLTLAIHLALLILKVFIYYILYQYPFKLWHLFFSLFLKKKEKIKLLYNQSLYNSFLLFRFFSFLTKIKFIKNIIISKTK